MFYKYYKKLNLLSSTYVTGSQISFFVHKSLDLEDMKVYKEGQDFELKLIGNDFLAVAPKNSIHKKESDWSGPSRKVIGNGLLVRYTIFNTPWLGIKVHKFLKSDTDCLHDNPWDSISLILKGCYFELTETVAEIFSEGDIIKRKAEHKHSIHLCGADEAPIPCWTLFITFKRRRNWGFWKDGKFTGWRWYKNEGKC